jgi:hypothetical protein
MNRNWNAAPITLPKRPDLAKLHVEQVDHRRRRHRDQRADRKLRHRDAGERRDGLIAQPLSVRLIWASVACSRMLE